MVKAGLLLKSIGDHEKMEVPKGRSRPLIDERAGKVQFSSDHFRDKMEKADALDDFRQALLNDKIFELIKSSATITEESTEAPFGRGQAREVLASTNVEP